MADRTADDDKNQNRDIGLAIAGIGAAIAGGTSQYAMTNIGQGFTKGLPGLQKVFDKADARKDKNLELNMAMVSADQSYKTAERNFALKVENRDISVEQAGKELNLKKSQLLASTINSMGERDDKKAALREQTRHHKAMEGKPGAAEAYGEFLLNLDKESRDILIKSKFADPYAKYVLDQKRLWVKAVGNDNLATDMADIVARYKLMQGDMNLLPPMARGVTPTPSRAVSAVGSVKINR